MTSEEEIIGEEAVRIANEIEAVCVGKPTPAVILALSMVIGESAARAPKPDFPGFIKLITRAAFDVFVDRRRVQRNG